MEDNFVNNVVSMYQDNNWRGILNLEVDLKNESSHSLLWVWPSKENLMFIKHVVEKFKTKGVVSIGCGSGLFEWLLLESTEISVTGIEVDESWWSSKYAKYKFIQLKFTKMPPDVELLPEDHALLFCYFNNGPAFQQYIKQYKGHLVFIIGPGPDRGTLTNPEPFTPDFGSNEWILVDHQEVRESKDFIAVYTRRNIIPEL